jgi:hypothetical protein
LTIAGFETSVGTIRAFSTQWYRGSRLEQPVRSPGLGADEIGVRQTYLKLSQKRQKIVSIWQAAIRAPRLRLSYIDAQTGFFVGEKWIYEPLTTCRKSPP